jgi:hypothetical protein
MRRRFLRDGWNSRGENDDKEKAVGPKFDFFCKPIIPNSWKWPSFILPMPFGELQNYTFWGGKNGVLLAMLLVL